MKTRPTIRDVASAAGVSVGTASRVINANATVTPGIRERVLGVIRDLGFEPNVVAQAMRSGTTHTIGVIVRDITVPIFADFVRAIEARLDQAGYSLLIACSEDEKAREMEILRVFGRRKVDGLIMTTVREDDDDLVALRRDLGIPIVFMDREVPGGYDSVILSHSAGTRAAIAHLLALGHRRIGLVTGPDSLTPGRERVAAYRAAFEAAGVAPDMSLVRTRSFDDETCLHEALGVLAGQDRATAIVAGGFNVIGPVLRAVRERGLAIPRDVAVVAGADSELTRIFDPPIDAVTFDMAQIGATAAEVVLQRISDRSADVRRVQFETSFVARRSSGPTSAARGRGAKPPGRGTPVPA